MIFIVFIETSVPGKKRLFWMFYRCCEMSIVFSGFLCKVQRQLSDAIGKAKHFVYNLTFIKFKFVSMGFRPASENKNMIESADKHLSPKYLRCIENVVTCSWKVRWVNLQCVFVCVGDSMRMSCNAWVHGVSPAASLLCMLPHCDFMCLWFDVISMWVDNKC